MGDYKVSKSRFAKAVMPSVGDYVGGYRVNYTSLSQFRFTITDKKGEINMGDGLKHNGAIFKATHMNFNNNKVTFELAGFEEMDTPKTGNEATKVDLE